METRELQLKSIIFSLFLFILFNPRPKHMCGCLLDMHQIKFQKRPRYLTECLISPPNPIHWTTLNTNFRQLTTQTLFFSCTFLLDPWLFYLFSLNFWITVLIQGIFLYFFIVNFFWFIFSVLSPFRKVPFIWVHERRN